MMVGKPATPREETERHDPFRKIYLYGEEAIAADDAAFILFNLNCHAEKEVLPARTLSRPGPDPRDLCKLHP